MGQSLLVQSLFVHVSLGLEGGSLGAILGAVVESTLVEGVGAMGVASTTGLLEVWVEVLENLDGTYFSWQAYMLGPILLQTPPKHP